jgi:glycolate oxidase iron-sulfur subunit
MQTNFTAEQLKPIRTSRILKRSCAPACIAAFAPPPARPMSILGDELDSPRGRIYLIKDMLENNRRPTSKPSSTSTAACPASPA